MAIHFSFSVSTTQAEDGSFLSVVVPVEDSSFPCFQRDFVSSDLESLVAFTSGLVCYVNDSLVNFDEVSNLIDLTEANIKFASTLSAKEADYDICLCAFECWKALLQCKSALWHVVEKMPKAI